MALQHLLALSDLAPENLRALIQRAQTLKHPDSREQGYEPLRNRVLGMVFEKSSTRTRVAFETAMAHLGGHAVFLSPRDTQLGRGEPIEDTARVLSRMVDAIMIRTYEHDKLERFAAYSRVPVINALTDRHHPCQLLADILTFQEHRGDIRERTVAWIGDGNNMCNSYVEAARLLGFNLRIATPPGYEPEADLVATAGARVQLGHAPLEAARDADLITTDVWASMGQEAEQTHRRQAFAGFKVTAELMARARPEALLMHCLPAHRGEEISAEVIDGPQSVVWDQAENRLHSTKALLETLLS